jgi:glycosyltransferase involved in cell wall biosynthesis/predicted ATP-grasp superfamily ATP-dependent carboligase
MTCQLVDINAGVATASSSTEAVRLMKFVTVFCAGGTERQVLNLGLALDPSRFAVQFGCLNGSGEFREEVDARSIPVFQYDVKTFRRPSVLAAQLRLAWDIRRHKIQIVHTYNFYANLFAIPAARLAGAQVVASIRDMGVYLSPTQQRLQRYACKLADRILVNANAIKEWLVADGYNPDRITVIPNGIDLARFERPSRIGSVRQEFGVPTDAPVIGLLTRIVPSKGIEDFLKAAVIVASRVPAARFLIVGSGLQTGDNDYSVNIIRMAEELGLADRVVFTGFRADVERVLPEFTVSVQPSLSEALSNVVLESMAAGVPVVATRVGGTTEAVRDGENGLLVPPGNPQELAEAVCRLLEAPVFARRLAMAGQRSVQQYSMRNMVERTSGVYQSLIEPAAHRPAPTRRESPPQPLDALVLDAGLRQSLVALHSLGQRNRSVGAVEITGRAPAFSSRWCRQAFICPAEHGTDAYRAYLDNLLDRTGARVLIASHDGTIALLRQHRAYLEQRVRLALASERALSIAVSKERTLEVAKRLGIRVPRSFAVHNVSEIAAALQRIGFPAVVKPVESWIPDVDGGVRLTLQVVTTAEEARKAVVEQTRLGGSCLFQQVLSGRREAVMLFYANGQIHARFAQWAKRTCPPFGGESVLRQSIAVPDDTGFQAEQLVREIGLEGYSEVEFRRDSNGVPYLMEINPRLSASVEIAVRSGVDFPYLLYQWASGEPIDKVDTYSVGGWMRHLNGDIITTLTTVRQPRRPGTPSAFSTVLGFCLSFLRPMDYDYLHWKDPLPAVRATANFTRNALKKLMRGLTREAI